MEMQLELTSEQKTLISEKNIFTEQVLQKYRLAGQIVQTGLVFIQILLLEDNSERSVGDICRLGDLFLQRTTSESYRKHKAIQEKGIALPVQIEKEDFVSGVSPEKNDVFQGGYIGFGDIVKITLGVHIDGYTVQASHTVVIRDGKSDAQLLADQSSSILQPLQGAEADAICACHIATEAVLNLLSLALRPDIPAIASLGQVTGSRIKKLVESIASMFRVKIVPGSRVRRVRRFLAGQSHVVKENDFKGVEWNEQEEEQNEIITLMAKKKNDNTQVSTNVEEEDFSDDFVVSEGEVWLIDIQMAATGGKKGVIRLNEFKGYDSDSVKPSIYSRDFTIQYGLKLNSSRSVLSKSASSTSVYPFKLSYLADNEEELRTVRLGLSEIVQHHMFVPHEIKTAVFIPTDAFVNGNPSSKEIKRASTPVNVAREMCTVMLVPAVKSLSGSPEIIRLTGGSKTASPSWVHSNYEITDEQIAQLLQFRREKRIHGINFQEVQASKVNLQQTLTLLASTIETAEMDLD